VVGSMGFDIVIVVRFLSVQRALKFLKLLQMTKIGLDSKFGRQDVLNYSIYHRKLLSNVYIAYYCICW
jgi:hypothetical protein